MIDELFGNVGIEIRTFNEAQEEFIDDLYVRPSDFEHRLIFLWIKGVTLWIHGWRYRSEKVLAKHFHSQWVHRLCDDLSVVGDVVE